MTPEQIWDAMELKLIAILRGLTPAEAPAIVKALLEAGFRAIEVPLNSPEPFESIRIAAQISEEFGPCLVGAGTVLYPDDVARVAEAGGNLVVSPDIEPGVVSAALEKGMASFPGVFTATEAHRAVRLNATGLKVFPASSLGPGGIKALMATLPAGVSVCAVGGVGPEDFAGYRAAGVAGFGLGSSLYKPGKEAQAVRQDALHCAQAFRAIFQA